MEYMSNWNLDCAKRTFTSYTSLPIEICVLLFVISNIMPTNYNFLCFTTLILC